MKDCSGEVKIVLIIEDDDYFQHGLIEEFNKNEIECISAMTEVDAENELLSNNFLSAVIIDVMVPVVNLTMENYEKIQEEFKAGKRPLNSAKETGIRIVNDLINGVYPNHVGVPLYVFSILDKKDVEMKVKNLGANYLKKDTDGIEAIVKMVKRRIG